MATYHILRPGDLAPNRVGDLTWSDGDCEKSLQEIYAHVTRDAENAIAWYQGARRVKRWQAVAFRLGALVMVAAAGLIPMIAVLEANSVPAILASIAVALAATFVGLDRFFGSSSAWIRYMTTELRLRAALEEFELDWHRQRAGWRGQTPSEGQVDAMLHRCREFIVQINSTVEEETASWVTEFQATLNQMDEVVKAADAEVRARRASQEPGAVNLVVTNGNQVDRDWTLAVNDGSGKVYVGRTAAVRGLPPGVHVFKVVGLIGGNQKQAEVSASVLPGASVTAEMTLD